MPSRHAFARRAAGRQAGQFVAMVRLFALAAAAAALTAAVAVAAAPLPVALAAPDTTAVSAHTAAPLPFPIDRWLVLGPVDAPLPVFHADNERGYKLDDLFAQSGPSPDRAAPRPGRRIALPGAGAPAWREAAGVEMSLTPPGGGEAPAQAWLACWLDARRWLAAELTVASAHPVRAYLDGAAVELRPARAGADSAAAAAADTAAGPVLQGAERAGTLKLTPGKHLLMLHAVRDPAAPPAWAVSARLAAGAEFPADALSATLDPSRAQNIHDVLRAPAITSAALSPDGRLAALSLAQADAQGERQSWLEIRAVKDGKLVQTWRGGVAISQVRWAPHGQRFAYVARGEKAAIWIYDLTAGKASQLIGSLEEFGEYQWGPDGTFLVHSFTIKAEPDKRRVKRVLNVADRQPGWRDRSHLMQVSVPDGATRRLTAGPHSVVNWRICPDGRRVLFFRGWPDHDQRPYSASELWELDLRTLAAEMITAEPWLSGAEYGPEPHLLALQGAPSAFDGLGRNLPAGVVANDYGGQLYLYDRRTGKPEAVSRDFHPDIQSLSWSHEDGLIYAQVVEGQRQQLYAFEPQARRWRRIDTGLEMVEAFDLAGDERTAIALGSGAVTPQRLVAIDLRRGRHRVLLEPAAEALADVRLGRVEQWRCRLPGGGELDGRVYYPLAYDPARRYPVIVYYYGGTTPVGCDFAGRYPKNVWAGLGYFVYVPQPSGAIGYGQEFAARHVNDWGALTAQEVIDGTRAFLQAFPAADPRRVGCMGASYGGFLTQLLVTRTDLFAAAISHAGISSISSYWGEGYWGYAYGARALAHAFPWSHRDIYVERSPLFQADKITTPLLLLHGGADTNVPPGESDQLYTALKLLGREVEYVRIEGQDHHILDHKQRLVWNDTQLAWFARHLKGEAQWWQELYPE